MNEVKTPRKRQPINEISRIEAAAHVGEQRPRIWDRQATILHLIRAVSVPSTGLAGTQGCAQFWLRPKDGGLAQADRSTGYVIGHDAVGLEIQLEERTQSGTLVPTVIVFIGWANVAGLTTR